MKRRWQDGPGLARPTEIGQSGAIPGVFSSDDDEEAAGPASRRAGGAKSVASHKSKGLKVCIPLCMISPSAV